MSIDQTITYLVAKKEPGNSNIEAIINLLIHYVQNTPIYFKTEPFFCFGQIIFTIIGEEKDQKEFQEKIEIDLNKFNGKLIILKEK